MKGKPGKMLKLMRGSARSSGSGDQLSVTGEMTQGVEAAAAAEKSGAVQIPRQAGAAGGFREGDRVMLVVPFWGALDQETGVLVRDRNGAQSGKPPTYRARSQGTVIYPHPAPEDFIYEMRAKGSYLIMMDDGRKLYASSSSPQPWVNSDLKRIAGQCQVTHRNGQTYVRPTFNRLDRVQLKESFICRNNGQRYEAGWRGTIFLMARSMQECWDSGLYEVSLDDDPVRGDRGMVTVYAESLVLIRPAPHGS